MTHAPAREDFVGLPEVAERLGVHRATVNDMVKAGRLVAVREGAHWLVERSVLEQFAATYVKPSNAPARRQQGLPTTAPALVALLDEFESASPVELARFMDLHEGNVRKHLRLMELAGLVDRRADGQWGLTRAGLDLADGHHSAKSVA